MIGMVIGVSAVGVLSTLGVRSLVVDTVSASPDVPNPGHSYDQIEFPGRMWHSNDQGPGTGMDADTVDGVQEPQIHGTLTCSRWQDTSDEVISGTASATIDVGSGYEMTGGGCYGEVTGTGTRWVVASRPLDADTWECVSYGAGQGQSTVYVVGCKVVP
jgi:hypothetical protein